MGFGRCDTNAECPPGADVYQEHEKERRAPTSAVLPLTPSATFASLLTTAPARCQSAVRHIKTRVMPFASQNARMSSVTAETRMHMTVQLARTATKLPCTTSRLRVSDIAQCVQKSMRIISYSACNTNQRCTCITLGLS